MVRAATTDTLVCVVWLTAFNLSNASSAVPPSAADDDPDGLVDDRAVHQRVLQVRDQPVGLREDLRVLHRDRGGHREQFTKLFGPVIERVRAVGVYVHRPDDVVL